MVVLNASTVNIALPQTLGERVADFVERKRAFMIGLIGFAASVLGGFASYASAVASYLDIWLRILRVKPRTSTR